MDLLIKCNVGTRERQVRFAAGLAATIGAYYSQQPAARAGLGLLGLFGIATGASRYCPVSQLLGINQCQPAYRSLKQILRRI